MVAAKTRQDDELTELLTKLYTIQEDIGAKPKTSEEEKKSKAENIAVMGTSSKKAAAKGGKFLELKTTIIDRLKTIAHLLKETKEKEKAGFGGDNAKDIIKAQAEIREHIRQAQDEWKLMDEIYKKEARKKKSKFTIEELEVQAELVKRLYVEIEKVKDTQARGYARGGRESASGLPTKSLYSDIGSGRKSKGFQKGTGGGTALTDGQKSQIMALEQRDAEFDKDLDEIAEGIQDLGELAEMMGEEVKRQSVMLENVNNKMDKVNERMHKVNTRMKDTLDEIGRSKDKLCIDIMCIVLMVGFAAVIYNFIRN